jgi:hypothetical protein
MDFSGAVTFPFRQNDWFTKILLPSAFLCIPILGIFLVAGWALEISRRVIHGKTPLLPAADFRRNLADGAAVMGILALCALPFCLWIALGGIAGAAREAGTEGTGGFDLLWWGIECAGLASALAGAVWAAAAVGFLADTGSFRSVFQIRKIFTAIRSAPAAFGLAALAWIPLGMLAFSGTAVCCVGALCTTVYAAASAFHLAGQAYALAAGKQAGVPPPSNA